MRLAKVTQNGAVGLAVDTGAGVKALFGDAALYDLDALIASGGSALTDAGAKVSAEGEEVQVEDLTFLPPLVKAPKIDVTHVERISQSHRRTMYRDRIGTTSGMR